MSKTRKDNPFRFSTKEYWKRRKQGLHGTKHPEGSPEERYDKRLLERRKLKLLQGEKDDD